MDIARFNNRYRDILYTYKLFYCIDIYIYT